MAAHPSDEAYLRLVLDALEVCRRYRPKFGKGRRSGFTLDEFRQLYQADPFYTWFGLDSPLVYAAHKAAGGITSVYRQIGIACERLIRQVFQDALGVDVRGCALVLPGTGTGWAGADPVPGRSDPAGRNIRRIATSDAA